MIRRPPRSKILSNATRFRPDGKNKGKDEAQVVYYVLVKAKGADGKTYNIKRDVNLLRGYTEGTNTGGGTAR